MAMAMTPRGMTTTATAVRGEIGRSSRPIGRMAVAARRPAAKARAATGAQTTNCDCELMKMAGMARKPRADRASTVKAKATMKSYKRRLRPKRAHTIAAARAPTRARAVSIATLRAALR